MKAHRVPSAAEIEAAYAEGKTTVNGLVDGQTRLIRALEDQIRALEGQTEKNSGNSSKPPSSDSLKKVSKRSLRQKRRPGQNGG